MATTWRCSFCDTYNRVHRESCMNCDRRRSEPAAEQPAAPAETTAPFTVPFAPVPDHPEPSEPTGVSEPTGTAAGPEQVPSEPPAASALGGDLLDPSTEPPAPPADPLLGEGGPAPSAPPAPPADPLLGEGRPAPASGGTAARVPAQPWRCLRCSTRNPAACRECRRCGTDWVEATDVLAAAQPPKTSQPRSGAEAVDPAISAEFWQTAEEPTAEEGPAAEATTPRQLLVRSALTALAVLGPLLVVGLLLQSDEGEGSEAPPDPSPDSGTLNTGDACPERISARLPEPEGARLVEAFLTDTKQITLCRTSSSALYYHGEYREDRSSGVAVPAEPHSEGYVAVNGPYRYEIFDDEIIVREDGAELSREHLVPLWDPE